MEPAESSSDSPRVFTREKWFVQLGMAARGITCCSKCGISGRILIQVSAFKLPAYGLCGSYSNKLDRTIMSGRCGSYHLAARRSDLRLDIPRSPIEREMRLLRSEPQHPLAWIRRPRDWRRRLRPCDCWRAWHTSARGRG